MAALADIFQHQLLVFALVLARVGALLSTAPLWGVAAVPMQARALAAVTLAMLITPLQSAAAGEAPANLLDLGASVAGEMGIGAALGLGMVILFSGLQIAGQIAGQMSGIQLADAFDPATDVSAPVFGQLLNLTALAVFLLAGGHRQVLGALLDTFAVLPPGAGVLSQGIVPALVELTTQSCVLGIRAAAPIIAALLTANLVLGLASRTLPQLNVMAVGFSINSLVMLGTFALSLHAAVWMFQDQIEPAVDALRDALLSTAAD